MLSRGHELNFVEVDFEFAQCPVLADELGEERAETLVSQSVCAYVQCLELWQIAQSLLNNGVKAFIPEEVIW